MGGWADDGLMGLSPGRTFSTFWAQRVGGKASPQSCRVLRIKPRPKARGKLHLRKEGFLHPFLPLAPENELRLNGGMCPVAPLRFSSWAKAGGRLQPKLSFSAGFSLPQPLRQVFGRSFSDVCPPGFQRRNEKDAADMQICMYTRKMYTCTDL